MGKLFNVTPEQEKEFQRKAKQYNRVKLIIIITAFILAVVTGIIVVGNGKIFKLFGVEDYGEGLNIFFMAMYILIMIGIVFFLYLIISVGIKMIIEFIKDKFFRK